MTNKYNKSLKISSGSPWKLCYSPGHLEGTDQRSDLTEKATETQVPDITHPDYANMVEEWRKWRVTLDGGDFYVEQFVKKFSKLEDNDDFQNRKDITPIPAFAKSSVIDIKNAIFQRLIDVKRENGPASYRQVIDGSNHGVDLLGNSMDGFMGRIILPELLALGKVGIYVDMPLLPAHVSIAEKQGLRPYIYMYQTEDIRSWAWENINERSELAALLLRDNIFAVDPVTKLPVEEVKRYRLYDVVVNEEGKRLVRVQFYDQDGDRIFANGQPGEIEPSFIILDLPRIPFIMLELTSSLLKDTANHQIALTNMTSSDIAYSLKSNFPFYVEQFDFRSDSPHLRQSIPSDTGEATEAAESMPKQIELGIGGGRRYPQNLERPGFIHPSSEPLTASMAKQEQLKQEIRQIVNLTISNLQPVRTSAEAKAFDERGLEAGLSYIGLELEYAERRIAEFWSEYEGIDDDAVIKYPETYSLRSIQERRSEAKELQDIKRMVPSLTFQKKIAKQQVEITVGPNSSLEELERINAEIDRAKFMTSEANEIQVDVELGLVSNQTASTARGYAVGEAEQAKQDHAERLARIAAAQSSPDSDAMTNRDVKKNANDKNNMPIPIDATRGDAE